MRAYLRLLAVVLLVGGLGVCLAAVRMTIADEAFFKAARALDRHPDHVLFQVEYYSALARHIAYILTAVVSGMLAVVGSALLFGIAAILRRVERAEDARVA